MTKDLSRKDSISQLPGEDQERARRAVIDKAGADQPAFVNDFIASSRDVHDLPIAELSPQVRITLELTQAVHEATAIVRGTVVSQRVAPDHGVASVVRVAATLKGTPVVETSLLQPAGPYLNGRTGVLVQFRSDPIVYRGREYCSFLHRASPLQLTCAQPQRQPRSK